TAALGQLVLVVGKDQVDAAAVDVESLAQVPPGHGRTFDMPARPTATPGGVPAALGVVRRLPQDEVHRVLLVWSDIDTRACQHLVHAAPGEPAITGHRRHV